MPLIFKEKFQGDCLFGIWEISETFEELLSEVHLFPGEREKLFKFRSDARKVEFLSVRILLKALIGVCGPIVYSDLKKPYLHQSDLRISISHSKNLTSIMLSNSKKIGIDLEYMSHRISKVQHKFINDDEFITSEESKQKYHLYIHWCAKEALFKICDKQDINRSTCQSCWTKLRRHRVKLASIRLLGNKCSKCDWQGHWAGYEFHNHETGHCYIDYVERTGMGEKDGYIKTTIYFV